MARIPAGLPSAFNDGMKLSAWRRMSLLQLEMTSWLSLALFFEHEDRVFVGGPVLILARRLPVPVAALAGQPL